MTSVKDIQIDPGKLEDVVEGGNVRYVIQGDALILVIDMSKDLGLSSTGKMRSIANTSGFKPIRGGMSMNLYLGKRVK